MTGRSQGYFVSHPVPEMCMASDVLPLVVCVVIGKIALIPFALFPVLLVLSRAEEKFQVGEGGIVLLSLGCLIFLILVPLALCRLLYVYTHLGKITQGIEVRFQERLGDSIRTLNEQMNSRNLFDVGVVRMKPRCVSFLYKQIVVWLVVVLARTALAGMLNIVDCPDCGASVSTRAYMCPKCGCSREAIQQEVRALEALSRLSPVERKRLTDRFLPGYMMRAEWKWNEQRVQNILTNEVRALANYTPRQREVAQEACVRMRRVLDLGFTLDRVFMMCPDLVNAVLGDPVRNPRIDK